ncbi:hypothetical protein J6590_067401 [Homalodisca vitripennis]|nr:hypothetical protein J6590_067401 [Homalodisca vitripennis]
MSYHSVRSSQTGPRSVVSPSKFQLVLQISKSLSSVATLVFPITLCVQTGPRSVVSPSKFQLVSQISKSLSSVATSLVFLSLCVQVRLVLKRSIAERVPTRVTDKYQPVATLVFITSVRSSDWP